ncbi:MAG TPA: hypothetical protein DEA08_23315, partial [Planctomycetes bacterium]|nr:hypothetical protein [Planctomycetota bacterium]
MRALPPVLAIALSVAATATADPLGRERLKEVLAEHGQAEPLVVMAELAKQGNLTIDRSDAIAGAISAPVSPAVRTWLGNTQRIRTQDGRLLLKADQGFRVPTQNGAQLEFGDRFRLDLEPDGRVSTRGLGVRPPKAIHTGPVKGALLDSKGIYGLDLGKPGSRERVVQLRPKAPTPVEELGEKIVEKSMDVLRDQHRRMLDDMVREPRRDADPETPAPTQAAPRASMPRAQVADAAPASAPRVERPAAAVDPAEVTLADPASGATEGGEDKLRKLFGLEGGGDAAFRPIGPGSEGVAVRDLQRRLQVAGQPLEVDGKFGPGTADALKQ